MFNGETYAPELDDTGYAETESHRTEFGAGFGNQFTYATHAPEPDDAGDADRPLSSETDSPGKTESYQTEFGAEFGNQFPEVRHTTAPDDTEVGDPSPLARPDLSGDPGGPTNPDRTVPDYVNRVTQVEYDDCFDLLCDEGEGDISSICDSPGLFPQNLLQLRLVNTGL